MSCSDELVSKQYLEDRLAQIDFSLSGDGQRLIVRGLVNEREIDFGSLLGVVKTLIQLAVDGFAAFLGSIIYAVQEATRRITENERRVDDVDTKATENQLKIFALNTQIILYERNFAEINDKITAINKSIDKLSESDEKKRIDILKLESEFAQLKRKQDEEINRLEGLIQAKQNDIDELFRSLDVLKLGQNEQDRRLNFIDESLRELSQINEILLAEFGALFANLAQSIAANIQDIYELERQVVILRELIESIKPTFSLPSIRTYPIGEDIVLEITTDGGTAREVINLPDFNLPANFNPAIDLVRDGQNLTVNFAIAGKTASDTETLPPAVIEETNEFKRIVNNVVDLSELEQTAKQIEENMTLMNAAIATVIVNNGEIIRQTSLATLERAASAGTCSTLNGGCGQNFRQQIKNDGVENLNGLELGGIGAVSGQVAAVQTRLDTLFNRLGVDRAMHALNIALGIHNAVAVSRAVGQTLGYVIDSAAQASGFTWTNTAGDPITFSQAFGQAASSFTRGLIGDDLANNLSKDFNKLLRIYQTGQNVAWAVRGIIDPLRASTEIITDNTGKIGNALRKSGAVLENSYQVLPERTTLQSATAQKISNYTASVQELGEGLELFGELTENTIEIQDSMAQLRQSNQAFDAEINTLTGTAETDLKEGHAASLSPNISVSDLIPKPINP